MKFVWAASKSLNHQMQHTSRPLWSHFFYSLDIPQDSGFAFFEQTKPILLMGIPLERLKGILAGRSRMAGDPQEDATLAALDCLWQGRGAYKGRWKGRVFCGGIVTRKRIKRSADSSAGALELCPRRGWNPYLSL